MRSASVHKIGSDSFRVTFSFDGRAVAEFITTSGDLARNIKRTYEKTGDVPVGTSNLAAAAA